LKTAELKQIIKNAAAARLAGLAKNRPASACSDLSFREKSCCDRQGHARDVPAGLRRQRLLARNKSGLYNFNTHFFLLSQSETR